MFFAVAIYFDLAKGAPAIIDVEKVRRPLITRLDGHTQTTYVSGFYSSFSFGVVIA